MLNLKFNFMHSLHDKNKLFPKIKTPLHLKSNTSTSKANQKQKKGTISAL
jgi:hypothetical protein